MAARHVHWLVGLGVAALVFGADRSDPVRYGTVAHAAKKATKRAKRKSLAADAARDAEERSQPIQFDFSRRGAVDMDERADRKRDEAIEKLKRLLPSISDGPQKAELIFRLSEMYWTKAKFLHLKAMQSWDAQLDTWYQSGSRGTQPAFEDVEDGQKSLLYKAEALKLYETILAEYPTYPRKDEVLYNLGSSFYEAGDKSRGVKMYWTLIKQYPDSGYAPDAWLQLGEHFFNNNKLAQAIKAYGKAAETKKPRIYSFALYKLAWCDYNLGEYRAALKKFRDVIAYANKQQAGDVTRGEMGQQDRVQLVSEALNDMVRAYSHVDAVDEAFTFYTAEVGSERAYRYLRRLGALYDDEGKYETEIETFRRLNRDYPDRTEAPQNQTAIMNAYVQLDQPDAVRREVRTLIDLYSPGGSWAQKNIDNRIVLQSAFDVVESELARLVTEQHREAQKSRFASDFRLARDIYQEYLGKFQDSVNAYKFRFFYAEILYDLQQFRDAAAAYERVVAVQEEGEFAKPAAYARILSLERVAKGEDKALGDKIQRSKRGKGKGRLAKLDDVERLKKGQTYAPKPLDELQQQIADACDAFVAIAPSDKDALTVRFKTGQIYYSHNRFEMAAERFSNIIAKAPGDALARLGAQLIMESFNIREDWPQLNVWARKFQGNKALTKDRGFRDSVAGFVEGASFNEILHVVEPQQGPVEAGTRYVGFVDEFPRSRYALVALYNAILRYADAGREDLAITQGERLLKDHKRLSDNTQVAKDEKAAAALNPPNLLQDVTFKMGGFHERLAQWRLAAKYYEGYAIDFPQGKQRADALFNAGVLRQTAGETEQAIERLQQYVADFPTKKDALQVAWRAGALIESLKDPARTEAYFGAYKRLPGRHEPARLYCAEYKVFQARTAQEKLTKPNDRKRALEALRTGYQRLTRQARLNPCALDGFAQASFELLVPELEAYLALKLTGGERQMSRRLRKKLELVDDLQAKYTNVLAIGQGDYGIAALYRIGTLYQNLAQAIFETPCPRRLTSDQCDIYQAALQEKAFPLEEKAIDAFDKAVAKAYELGLYNDWLRRSQEALTTYEPGRYPERRTLQLVARRALVPVPTLSGGAP